MAHNYSSECITTAKDFFHTLNIYKNEEELSLYRRRASTSSNKIIISTPKPYQSSIIKYWKKYMVRNDTSSEIPPRKVLELLQRWHIREKMAKYG